MSLAARRAFRGRRGHARGQPVLVSSGVTLRCVHPISRSWHLTFRRTDARPRGRAETHDQQRPLSAVASSADPHGDPGEARTRARSSGRVASDVKAGRSASRCAGRHKAAPTRLKRRELAVRSASPIASDLEVAALFGEVRSDRMCILYRQRERRRGRI